MLEDIRNHSSVPTAQEREWIAAMPFTALFRLGLQAAIALVIGLAASHALETEMLPAVTAMAIAPAP